MASFRPLFTIESTELLVTPPEPPTNQESAIPALQIAAPVQDEPLL